MKTRIWACLVLVALISQASITLAQAADKLTGTWIIDPVATEESVIRTRPFKDANSANSFTSQIAYLGSLILEFDGEHLYTGSFPGNERKFDSYLVSNQGAERKYKSKDPNGTSYVVSTLNDKNIAISDGSVVKYLLWKRVKLDPNKKKPDDFMNEFNAFFAMIVNIDNAYKKGN
jgi:hypothetical protein